MQRSVDIIQQHSEENERHRLLSCLFPPTGLSPHDAECGKEKSRQPHCRLCNERWQEAGCYSCHERKGYIYLVPYTPKYHQIDEQMEDVGMKEAIDEMILNLATLIEADALCA